MGCTTTVILFAVLFVGLDAFNCDNIQEICENEVAESTDEQNFEGNGAFHAFRSSVLNVESGSPVLEGYTRGTGKASGKGSVTATRIVIPKVSHGATRVISRIGSRRPLIGVVGSDSESGSVIVSATDSKSNTGANNPVSQLVPVTDADIEKFTNDLWKLSANNVNRYITVRLGERDASGIVTIEQPLLQVDQGALDISTIAKVSAMRGKYKLDITKADEIDAETREAEDLLIEDFILQPVIADMIDFLENKGLIDRGTGRETLRQIWFDLYSRGGGRRINNGSSGFQKVFLAELQPGVNKTIRGLHNWIYFHAKEVAGQLHYKGCIKNIPLGSKGSILEYKSTFKTKDGELINKPTGVMFIGTSPEMEMALYTLCFFVRPNGKCPVSLDGTKINIITDCVVRDGKKMVSTAYPEVLSSTMDLNTGC